MQPSRQSERNGRLNEMPRPSSPLLAFNFMPVSFLAEEFDGGLVEFESRERLVDLRAKLAGAHVVARTWVGIACIPLVVDVDLCGTPTTFVTHEYRSLTMRLVREALLRSVLGWSYKLRRRVPPTFVSRLLGKDLLEQLVSGRHHEVLGKLHVYPQFRLDNRIVGSSNRPGVIVGVKTRDGIDMTVDEVIDCGVNVNVLYVLGKEVTIEPRPGLDHYAARRTFGAVNHVDGTDLILHNAPGPTRIAASDASLESRRDTFNDVIGTLAGADEKEIYEDCVAHLADNGPYRKKAIFIYDQSVSAQEHGTTRNTLQRLPASPT